MSVKGEKKAKEALKALLASHAGRPTLLRLAQEALAALGG